MLRVLTLGVIGGFIGCFVYNYIGVRIFSLATAESDRSISANRFELVDKKGVVKAQLGFSNGDTPGLFLLDENGKARIVIALYNDGTGHVVLNDKNGNAVQILRSFGIEESPLHIFKLKAQDEMILGLNPGGNHEPFQFTYDKKRKKKLVFGSYDGP